MESARERIDAISEDHRKDIPSDLREPKRFEWYLNQLYEDPKIARNTHQRIADMFEYYGTERHDEEGYVEYHLASEDPVNDGEDKFYGDEIHRTIDKFVKKIRSGARGLGPERRIILLLGPVGSGKSNFDQQVRTYFEHYTREPAGRMYTFRWTNLCDVIEDQDLEDDVVRSPMTQDPLVLLPQKQRQGVLEDLNEELEAPYTLRNKQELDPESAFYMEELMDYYDDDLSEVLANHIKVVRLVADGNKRQCLETFEPKDKKNQDETELTGDVNYSKIAVYGESDPRAFDYSGAFCNANRGIFSGEELLKLQREFLYDFLHATQEQTIKPKNNPRIDIDQLIVGRTNMPEYNEKKGDEKMEAFNDRTKRIDFPYVLQYSEESQIYRKILQNADVPGTTAEPHTLEMAALFAVLSRIEEPDDEKLGILQKAKAYNGDSDYDIDVQKLRQEAEEEGMHGISSRFIADEIASAIVNANDDGSQSLSPLRVFQYFESNLEKHGSISEDRLSQYHKYLEVVREEYRRRAIEDVRHALAYDIGEIQRQAEKYMDHVMAYINDDTVEDELTGEMQEPDETFLRSVEKQLDITGGRKDDFRQEVSNWVSRRAREGETFQPSEHERLRNALEQKLWEDKKHNINFDVLVSGNEEERGDRSSWIEALKERGYSREGAEEVLEFAGASVAKEELQED